MNFEMNNPWEIEDAFTPMFTESVTINNMTVHACVFPIEETDPLSDVDATNDAKQYSVLILKKDWVSRTRMKIGDSVYSNTTNLHSKITSVDDEQTWYRLTTRSVK